LKEEVMIGWRDIDAARLDRLAIMGVQRRESTGTLQDVREQARTLGSHMPDDKYGRWKVAREVRHHTAQRFQATD
jgi:hypothetical protein